MAAASEETVAQEETPRSKRGRVRVPSSVLVTVLVAALSVWVAPAFTRQWEDRKQARQLQAQVAEDIALSTARLVNGGDAAGDSRIEWRAILDDWKVSHTRIDARLRVYFGPELRSLWKEFDWRIYDVAFLAGVAQTDPLETNSDTIAIHLDRVENFSRRVGAPQGTPGLLQGFLSDPDVRVRETGAANLLLEVERIADAIIDRLMATDPDAYSTTRGDLLRDLLP
jgi:hypothetical protein